MSVLGTFQTEIAKIMNEINLDQAQAEVKIQITKDTDGYNVIHIRELHASSGTIPNSDKEVVLQATRNLEKSFSNKGIELEIS